MNPIPEASTHAAQVDAIFIGLCVLASAVLLLLFGLLIGFSFAFRRGSKTPRPPMHAIVSREIEIGWTAATAFAFLFIFWWVASSQLSGLAAPADAMEIHVVARQWMWKFQHPSGAREINDLHVPSGVPVRLDMVSQDVIHSFFVPAFRIKQDVLPGRYVQTWFQATKPGVYDLRCAEYCGMDHAVMTGRVTVMTPSDYTAWTSAQSGGGGLAAQGGRLFVSYGCAACHEAGSPVRAPALAGLYGRDAQLANGEIKSIDEAYLRDAIFEPNRDVAAGFEQTMPSYQGAVSEEDAIALVAYIKSLAGQPAGAKP
jgi:cytochrome c oxidase subunit 2